MQKRMIIFYKRALRIDHIDDSPAFISIEQQVDGIMTCFGRLITEATYVCRGLLSLLISHLIKIGQCKQKITRISSKVGKKRKEV